MTSDEWDALTPDAQRIKVLELWGWKPDGDVTPLGKVLWDTKRWFAKKPLLGGGYAVDRKAPDVLNDLNAMHEVLESMPDSKWEDYSFELWVMIGGSGPRNFKNVIQASAAQRAKAFVLTMEQE